MSFSIKNSIAVRNSESVIIPSDHHAALFFMQVLGFDSVDTYMSASTREIFHVMGRGDFDQAELDKLAKNKFVRADISPDGRTAKLITLNDEGEEKTDHLVLEDGSWRGEVTSF